MPTNRTKNYELCQWEPEDQVLRTDFNDDNAKIDAALAGKAEASALAALSQRVDGKADATAQTSLSQTVSEHTAALDKKGNCVIHVQTYTGTGKFGISDPTVINLPRKTLLVLIHDGRGTILAARGMNAAPHQNGSSIQMMNLTWTETSLSFSSSTAPGQMNSLGGGYTVLALLAADG